VPSSLAPIARRLPNCHDFPLGGAIPSAIPRERSPSFTLRGKLAPASDGDARSVSRTEDSRFAMAAMLEAELCGGGKKAGPKGRSYHHDLHACA
jgi:hypothetical protein